MTMQRRRETKKSRFRGNLALKVLIGNAHVGGVIHAFAVLDNQQLRRGVLYLKSLCDCLRYVTVPNQVYKKNINRLHFFGLPGPFEAAQGHAADATTGAVFIDNGGALMRTVFNLIYRGYGIQVFPLHTSNTKCHFLSCRTLAYEFFPSNVGVGLWI